MESDEALLSMYRTRLSPQFPFVVVPDCVTSAELKKSQPFLFKTIRMVASLRQRPSMWKQRGALMQHISNAFFLSLDRSLDLLQGMIVFLGWYHYFCFAHGHFNNLAHLASSMIIDMRLDKARTKPLLRNARLRGIDPDEPEAVSNDEKRAILAVWYINSRFVTLREAHRATLRPELTILPQHCGSIHQGRFTEPTFHSAHGAMPTAFA
jgi:hypothetical protein